MTRNLWSVLPTSASTTGNSDRRIAYREIGMVIADRGFDVWTGRATQPKHKNG